MVLYSFPKFYKTAKSYSPLHPDEGVDMSASEAAEKYSKTVSAHNRAHSSLDHMHKTCINSSGKIPALRKEVVPRSHPLWELLATDSC